ncbi:MAG: hypothetical protein QM767_23420 [Anaeromyxobacter sp.]
MSVSAVQGSFTYTRLQVTVGGPQAVQQVEAASVTVSLSDEASRPALEGPGRKHHHRHHHHEDGGAARAQAQDGEHGDGLALGHLFQAVRDFLRALLAFAASSTSGDAATPPSTGGATTSTTPASSPATDSTKPATTATVSVVA